MSKLALTIVLLLGSLAYCNCISRKNMEKVFDLFDSFKTINKHLCDKVDSDNLEVNFREAKRWLVEEVNFSSNEKLLSALKLFTSMENMEKCTRGSVDILEQNNYLTNFQAESKNQESSTRIVDIILHFLREHSNECIPIYAKNLEQKYKEVGEATLQRVDYIVKRLSLVRKEDYGTVAYSMIRDLSKDDPENIYLGKVVNKEYGLKKMNDKKLRELYDKYLVEPCKRYTAMNDYQWYDLYRFDKKFTSLHKSEPVLQDFDNHYKVCKELTGYSNSWHFWLCKHEADLQIHLQEQGKKVV